MGCWLTFVDAEVNLCTSWYDVCSYAAIRMQRCFRRSRLNVALSDVQQHVRQVRTQRKAATRIQAVFRGRVARVELCDQSNQATTIQAAWRGFATRYVGHGHYRHLRDCSFT